MLKKLLKPLYQDARNTWTIRTTRQRVQQILAEGGSVKLEIGAWKKRSGIDLITIDKDKRADLPWDLANGVPFPDNSVSLFYTSHLLEHLTFWELSLLLRDCLRVLKPGGELSICVPNARLYADAYFNNGDFPPAGRQYEPGLSNTGSAIDKLNYIAYMRGHHKYMFDEENLINILTQCGFATAHLRNFDPRIDIPARDFESIYALAVKAGLPSNASSTGLGS